MNISRALYGTIALRLTCRMFSQAGARQAEKFSNPTAFRKMKRIATGAT
jgi:hypothetical protein